MGKDHASPLPPRVHPEETPGGHLLPAFRATALLCRPRPGMPAKATPMPQALAAARNQKREACGSKVITCEPTSSANELYRAIGAVCPVEIPLPCGKKWGRELRVHRLRSQFATLTARRPVHLLAKRGDNRVNDGGVLKLGDGEAPPACVLQRRPHQVALDTV